MAFMQGTIAMNEIGRRSELRAPTLWCFLLAAMSETFDRLASIDRLTYRTNLTTRAVANNSNSIANSRYRAHSAAANWLAPRLECSRKGQSHRCCPGMAINRVRRPRLPAQAGPDR